MKIFLPCKSNNEIITSLPIALFNFTFKIPFTGLGHKETSFKENSFVFKTPSCMVTVWFDNHPFAAFVTLTLN